MPPASQNEILMFLRRNNKIRSEVSFDKPLNMDWDGNQRLYSDVMGTDHDTIYRNIEEDKNQPGRFCARLCTDCGSERLWSSISTSMVEKESSKRRGGDITIIYLRLEKRIIKRVARNSDNNHDAMLL